MSHLRHLMRVFPALVFSLAALAPLTHAQSQATDCAPFELLYERQGFALPWTKGQCCSKTTGSSAYFACTPEGRVTLAYFCCQHFTGSIPSLAGLTFLQTLVLSTNSLTGPIPDLSSLTSLTDLELASNDLSGNIDGLLPPNLSRCWITLFSRNQGLYSCASRFPQSCFSHNQLYRTDPACPAPVAAGSGAGGSASAAAGVGGSTSAAATGMASSPSTPSTTATATDGSRLSAHTIGEPLATPAPAPSPSPAGSSSSPSAANPGSTPTTPTPDSAPGSINNVSGPVSPPTGQMSLTIPIIIGVVAAALVAVGVVMVLVGRRARMRGGGGGGEVKKGGAPAWLNLDAHHHPASMQEQDTKPYPSSIPTTYRSRSMSPSHLALPYSSTAPASQPYSASTSQPYSTTSPGSQLPYTTTSPSNQILSPASWGVPAKHPSSPLYPTMNTTSSHYTSTSTSTTNANAYAYTSPFDPSSLPTPPPPSANPDAYAVSPTDAAWTPPPTYPAPSPPAQGGSGLKRQFSSTKGQQAQGQTQGQRSPEYTVPVASSPEHEPAGGYETGYAHQQRYISTATSTARANEHTATAREHEYGMMLDMAAMMDSISTSSGGPSRHSGGSGSPDGTRHGGYGQGNAGQGLYNGSAGLTQAQGQGQGQGQRGSQTSSKLGLPRHRLEQSTVGGGESHRRPVKPSRSPESGGDGGAGGAEFSQRRVTWAEQLEVQEIFAVLSETSSVRGPVSPWAG